MQRQLIGEPAPDGDALACVEALERALFDVLGDRGEIVEIVGEDASAWPSTTGAASLMPATWLMRSATSFQSVSGDSSGCTRRCPLRPRILSSSSLRKPFITAITMMRVATPSMMPRNENPAMTEIKPSLRRARK